MRKFLPKKGDTQVSYESHELLNVPDWPYPVVKIKNTRIEATIPSHNGLSQKYYGNYFLLDLNGTQYFHTIYDQIGQYLALKEIIPDLKPLLSRHANASYGKLSGLQRNALKLFKISNGQMSSTLMAVYDTVDIENLYYYYQAGHPMIDKMPSTMANEWPFRDYDEQNPNGYNMLVSRKLREFINYDYPEVPTRKVFISRGKALLKLLNEEAILHHYDEQTARMFKDRFYPLEYNMELENYFEQHGYEIIDFDNKTMEQQIDIVANASHIAGIHGAGFTNLIWANPNAKVFFVNTHSNYTFIYRLIAKQFGMEPYIIVNPEFDPEDPDAVRIHEPGEIIHFIQDTSTPI